MNALICSCCGGNEFIEKNGYRICKYCNSKFAIPKEEQRNKNANINLNQDVKMLLEKCKTDPKRAIRYATLALEMDPNNPEAKAILAGKR